MKISDGMGGFRITDEDRHWVEENFRWLKDVFGYPNKMEEQVLINEKFFPKTFGVQQVSVRNVIDDLCKLFNIPESSVSYELVTDLRDTSDVPFATEGAPFEADTELIKGNHKIYVANSLQRHPERLIYCIIYEFIRIRLTESDLEFDVGGDDTPLFVYLAGIYYGFGVVLAQNLITQGRTSDGRWEIRWNYGSAMPQQVMAFSLATYANLTGDDNPSWRNEFKGDFRMLLDGALAFLKEHPNDLYDASEVKANDLFNLANEYFERNNLEEAIATLQKILFLTDDHVLKADVYNNMGYYYVRQKDYRQGISNFRKALALGPEYGFANDNLGYSLIMTGELEEGLSYLDKAMDTGNNDIAYSFRNYALYFQKIREYDQAEEYFQRAFEQQTPVDLLEYHYGEFLLEQGMNEKAREFFRLSAEKNEHEGIARLKHFTEQ